MTYLRRKKPEGYKELLVYKRADELQSFIYEITENFPHSELYGLSNQMRRAAVSITSNIAEGFGRQSYKDRLKFYYQAHGSLTELKDQIFVAKDIGYLVSKDFKALYEQANITHRFLQGFMSVTKRIINSK